MNVSLVGNTHIVAGGPETISDVLSFLRDAGIETRGNADVYVRVYRHFGIDEARELRERAALKPVGKRRVFVVAAPDMNREAQNALLKTLEEPPGDALFFFILPSPETLLPTLRSRVQLLALGGKEKGESVDVKKFLGALPPKRLELLKPLLEKGEDEKRDLGAILGFLASLERALAKAKEATGLHAARREGLESVYRARKYVSDRGALVKPLLEQVALLLPKV